MIGYCAALGSFKPYSAIGAKGPGYILTGVKLAIEPRWTGVLILNDRVMCPFGTLKKHDYFIPGQGILAEIKNFELRFIVPVDALKLKAT